MAEAFARRYGGDEAKVYSAGTMPASSVHPEVIEVMKEKGFDLSGKKPQMLEDAGGSGYSDSYGV